MDGWPDGYVGGWVDGQMMGRWMDGLVGEWVGGWMGERWMNGQMVLEFEQMISKCGQLYEN